MNTDNNSSGVAAILEFADDRIKSRVETFVDPEKIAPDVVAVVGRNNEGGTTINAVNFNRDAYRTQPLRRKGTIKTTTLDSFIALVNRQSGEQSVIFADDGASPSLTAVLNFHGPADDGAPSFCDDRITYAFPLSDEWKAWNEKNGKRFEQAEFAEFIENRLFDIGEPGSAGNIAQKFAEAAGVSLAGPQALRHLSKGLAIRVEHRMTKAVNLQSGEGRLEYSEEHKNEDGGPLVVPAAFHIFIPIMRGGPRYSIPVRLRYRTGGGKVMWFFEIHEAGLFVLDAVNDALIIVRKAVDATDDSAPPVATPGCGLDVFMGVAPA